MVLFRRRVQPPRRQDDAVCRRQAGQGVRPGALGDLSNKDPFNIGYYENLGNSPAHCEISQARVWKLPPDCPTTSPRSIAAHHRTARRGVGEPGQARGHFSRWMFASGQRRHRRTWATTATGCATPPGTIRTPRRSSRFPPQPTGKNLLRRQPNPAATRRGRRGRDEAVSHHQARGQGDRAGRRAARLPAASTARAICSAPARTASR